MPIICIGPVCIPVTVLWPILFFIVKPIYNLLPASAQRVVDGWLAWFLAWVDRLTPSFLKSARPSQNSHATQEVPQKEEGSNMAVEYGVRDLKASSDVTSANPEGVTLAFFTARWCGPCKTVKPKLPDLVAKFPKLVVLLIDVDDHEDVSEEYGVSAMPTFIVLNKGKEIFRTQGAGGITSAEEEIKKVHA
ncbi:Thioredoxin H-type [Diplonema papillatum]|nr:Thioredoxin H-type [Diplonema papillatum]